MTDYLAPHVNALHESYDTALTAVAAAADQARNAVDAGSRELRELGGVAVRPRLIPDVPVDALQPYIPPTASVASNALIPDTPLIDLSLGHPSAFDDEPLWHS